MRIGKINQTSFKGLYEIKKKIQAKSTKNVPADNFEKDSIKLEFAEVIYHPFKNETMNPFKIKANVSPGALEHGYTDCGDHYYVNAIVPELYFGTTLNFTQDEWERVTGKNIEDEVVTKEALVGKLEDKCNYITELTTEEAEKIKATNNFKASSFFN